MKSECNSVWKKVDKLFSSNKKSYIKQNKLYVGNKRRENQRENKCLTWMTQNMEKALFSLSSLGVCFSLSFLVYFPTLVKTSSTSRDTRKESQNPSVTKTYSVGFNHVKLLNKRWIQIIKPFWRYFMKNNQTIWMVERKIQEPNC